MLDIGGGLDEPSFAGHDTELRRGGIRECYVPIVDGELFSECAERTTAAEDCVTLLRGQLAERSWR